MKPTKLGLEEQQQQIHKIRITLSSKNVKNLEKGVYHVFETYSNLWLSIFNFYGDLVFC